ncbi:MAG: hypothetical protein Q9202_002608 [Teloschistes flavicans]
MDSMKGGQRDEDVIGQFPQLKTYNHGVFCFPIRDDVSHATISSALEAATSRIISKIPWLGEQVINEGKEPGDSGTFKTTPWPSDGKPIDSIVRSKDCSDICPSYSEILEANGPVSMLDGNVLCPLPGFPLSYEESKIGPAPVVAVQANFIKGGCLLNFSNQHNMMDATGLFTFIMLLATVMRGEEIPSFLIRAANLDRKTVIPLLPANEAIKDHSHLIRPSPPQTPQAAPTPIPATPSSQPTWSYFRIPAASIPRIKALATPSTPSPGVPFISTNDALCAFYWQRLAICRTNRDSTLASAMSKFSRAIDARAAMKTPLGYMGQMVYQSATHLSHQDLTTLPLPAIATRMRAALNDANTPYSIRSYATFLAGVRDKSTLAYAGVFNPRTDIGSSSMATAKVKLDFGAALGGEPKLARRPNLAPVPGCLYFYPEEEGGWLPVLVCLAREDLEAMKVDGGEEGWGSLAEWIG